MKNSELLAEASTLLRKVAASASGGRVWLGKFMQDGMSLAVCIYPAKGDITTGVEFWANDARANGWPSGEKATAAIDALPDFDREFGRRKAEWKLYCAAVDARRPFSECNRLLYDPWR